MDSNLTLVDTTVHLFCGKKILHHFEESFPTFAKIKETLLNKKNKIEKEMEKINTRLNNKSFIERAPNDIVEQEKSNFINLEKDVNKLNYTLESL